MPYSKPTPADLKTRYSAFAAVTDEVLQYWLTDAERGVDESWSEVDYAPALLALAAHNMAVEGVGAATSSSNIPAGVTSFRSGSFSVQFTEAAAQASLDSGLASTRYGAEYLRLLNASKGGPMVTASGYVNDGAGFNGWAGPLPPWQ